MENAIATRLFESLSSGIRLDLYRLLVKSGQDGMVAGQIAAALGLPASNVSFHLKGMTHAGLITVQQEGRFLRYRANLVLMLDLIAYLTEECCAGHPEQCASLRAQSCCSEAVLPPLPESGR
jgi:DNA-binding transcriptional ArsR family regulator